MDWVSFGLLQPDEAYLRLGARGDWHRGAPTPLAPNVEGAWLGLFETNGLATTFQLAFPTLIGASYVTEHTPSLSPPTWRLIYTNAGNNLEQVISAPKQSSGFFRVRREIK